VCYGGIAAELIKSYFFGYSVNELRAGLCYYARQQVIAFFGILGIHAMLNDMSYFPGLSGRAVIPGGLMSTSDDRNLRLKLAQLRQEHRDLDEAILALEDTALRDQLRLTRLKKRKLSLKDEIARLEDQLLPDIIA
jgi:hypothetical protein